MPDTILKDLDKFIALKGSQKAAAYELGISPQYISLLANGTRPFSPKLAAKLGWEKTTVWRRIKPQKEKQND